MSLYILDTDSVSLFQQQHPLIIQRINAVNPQQMAVTIVTVEEQMYGRLNRIRRANSPTALILAYSKLKYTIDYLTKVNVLDFTEEAYIYYAELIRQKIRIGAQDLRIASIALSVKGIVVTRNQKDFGKVPNLILEDWTMGSAL